jgi:hypothetical protein
VPLFVCDEVGDLNVRSGQLYNQIENDNRCQYLTMRIEELPEFVNNFLPSSLRVIQASANEVAMS